MVPLIGGLHWHRNVAMVVNGVAPLVWAHGNDQHSVLAVGSSGESLRR
ncbi:MAG: hypothetical protein M3176_06060 [Chloroflexota bacterium]|nr:hypothetical protein [Chloroflexota bacterium]